MAANSPNATDVESLQSAQQAMRALGSARELAVDVEADSMHHFHARLCFIQVASEFDIFLFDLLVAEVRAQLLAPQFEDPSIIKYFHAAAGDLSYLAEEGVRVRGLFDTHRAATLLGWPKIGLGDLVQTHLGVTLNKEHQQSDFSLRPLPAEMRAYIADDVRHLIALGRVVREACAAADIVEEVRLDCDRLCDEAQVRPDLLNAFRPKLPRQGLAPSEQALSYHIAVELNKLRLHLAEAADVPMGRMLSNAAIGAIATRVPSTVKELGRLEGVRGPFARMHGDAVIDLIAKTRERFLQGEFQALDAKRLADEKTERDSRRKKREEVLLQWRKEKAAHRKVTPSAILPNALVSELARTPPDSVDFLAQVQYFGEKRLTLYGAEIVSLLLQHR